MNHHQVQQLLARALDGQLAAAEETEVRAHLAGCPTCRAEQARLAHLDERLRREMPVAVRVPALDRAALRRRAAQVETNMRRANVSQRLSYALIGLAGVILLVLGLAFAFTHLLPQPGNQAPLPAVAATATPLLPSATATPTAPPPTATPTPPSTSPATYTSPNLHVSLQYPAGWQPAEPAFQPGQVERFSGPDGFFELAMAPLLEPAPMAQICEQEAAQAGRYGSHPQSQLTLYNEMPACTILNPDRNGTDPSSALLVKLPGSGVPNILFSLRADPAHFQALRDSLQLEPGLAALNPSSTPAVVAITTLPAGVTPAAIQATVTTFQDLTLEEYPVVSQAVDTPNHFEFNQRIPAEVFARRAAWRGYAPEMRLDESNRLLQPFGFSIRAAGENTWELLKAGSVLLQLSNFWLPSVGDQDFAMIVEQAGDQAQDYLVRSSGISAWDATTHINTRPVMLGVWMVSVSRSTTPGRVDVLRGDQVIYSYYEDTYSVDEPVKALWAWQGDWILEVAGDLIVNGQSLRQSLRVDEIFDFQVLKNGHAFYFFRKDGQVSLAYGNASLSSQEGNASVSSQGEGKTLPVQFDEVVHYQCCEPAAFNVGHNTQMVWFYGRRNGMWEYVELGIYP